MSSPVRSVMNGVQGFRLLRRVYILFAILCCTASVTAQIQVEYFWGTDKGLGKCTRVDGSAEIGGELNFKLPTGELPYGISCLGVRAFVESDTATYYSSTLYSYIVKTIDSEISEIEYFWNNDPGLGNATAVLNGKLEPGSEFSFSLPTDTLSPGIHCLGIRAKDLVWSPTVYSYIVKPGKNSSVTAVEYFWDNDPGFGKATRLAGGTAAPGESLTFSIPTDTLSPGIHRLGIRAKDLAWSPTVYSYIVKPGKDCSVTAVEYFWDNDPGIGKATKLASGTAVPGESLTFSIPTDTLSPGIHRLGIRAKDLAWSPAVYSLVLVETQSSDVYAQYIEYFWDEDPGFGNGMHEVLQPDAAGNEVSFEISTSGLQDGVHTLHVRTKAVGWSPVTHYYVRVHNGKVETIDDVEYFWDEDPGYGNGTKVPFEQGGYVDIKDFEPYVEGLTGEHTFCLRAHSAGGWSVVYMKKISLTAEGKYTLNENLDESVERNFRSVEEMLSFFIEHSVTADITIDVCDDSVFDFDATTAESFALLTGVADDLKKCNGRINFRAETSATINITVDVGLLNEAIAFASMTGTENVTLLLNGDIYNFALLEYLSDEMCPGGKSEAREWSEISEALDVEWSVIPKESCCITGYLVSGSGDLPSMTLYNTGTRTEKVAYNVSISKDGVEQLCFEYYIAVGPTIANRSVMFVGLTPADGMYADAGVTTISWSRIDAADSYVLVIEDNDEISGVTETSTIVQGATSYDLEIVTGHNYCYSVRACGMCDSTDYTTRRLYAFRTDAGDVEALKVLYNNLGGSEWSKQWLFDKEYVRSTDFPGVTFNSNGNVVAINLSACGLVGDLPTEGFVLPALEVLNMEKNNLTGDVAAFVDECENIQIINLGYNRLAALSSPLPKNITTMDFSGQYYNYMSLVPVELEMNELLLDKDNVNGIVATDIAWYNGTTNAFDAHPSFEIYSRDMTERYGSLVYMDNSYRLYFSGDYRLEQDVVVNLLQSSGIANNSLYPARLKFIKGDANVDADVDVLDVQHTLNYVVAVDGASGLFNFSAANTFEDALLNVQDIVTTVNIVLGDDVSMDASPNRAAAVFFNNKETDATIYLEDGAVMLASNCEIAALDIKLQGITSSQVELKLNNMRFSMFARDCDDGVRIIIMSLTGGVIPTGLTGILELYDNATISYVRAADVQAGNVDVDICNEEYTDIIEPEESELKISASIIDDELYVYSNKEVPMALVQIYSIDGKTLYSNRNFLLPGNNVVGVAGVDNGVYLLKISINGEVVYTCRLKQMTR